MSNDSKNNIYTTYIVTLTRTLTQKKYIIADGRCGGDGLRSEQTQMKHPINIDLKKNELL